MQTPPSPPPVDRTSTVPFSMIEQISEENDFALIDLVDETGREVLDNASDTKVPSPEKKQRKEAPGEFEAAFANMKTACTNAKIHLHKRDITYIQPCLDALSKLYQAKHARSNADEDFVILYEKEISEVMQNVFSVLSTYPGELSALTERELIGVTLEMTEPRYMNLSALVVFCCKGRLPSFKGEPGEALAKVLYKLAVHLGQQSCKGWTLNMIGDLLKENLSIVDANFVKTFANKEHKDVIDILFLASALKNTFSSCAENRIIPLFQSWMTLLKTCVKQDLDLLVNISVCFFIHVAKDTHVESPLLAIYIGPLIRDLNPQLPLEQLIPILKLLLWLVGNTALPSYCQTKIDEIVDKIASASDLQEDDYLMALELLANRYKTYNFVTELSDKTIERILILFNKIKNTLRAIPYLEKLAPHDRFCSLWYLVESNYFHAMSQFQRNIPIEIYNFFIGFLLNIQGMHEEISVSEAGQNALIQFIRNRILHAKPSLTLLPVEFMVCARNLSPALFRATIKELFIVHPASSTTPQRIPTICSLHHSDEALAQLVHAFLHRSKSRDIFLTILHYLILYQGFSITILDANSLLEILCERTNQLWKLDALQTFFHFPEIRNSPQAKLFFEQLQEDEVENCDHLIVLGKLATHNLLPEKSAEIVTNILEFLSLKPGALETTSKVFEAIGWLARANINLKLTKDILSELHPLIIQKETKQPHPFSPVQKQRIVFGIRELARNNIIPQKWIELSKTDD